ncbi:MAG: helix-turn-helix transcriptional regulator [Christensenellales bacterium]
MTKTINSDLIRGNINTIILKSLYDKDRYGYDIIKEIEEKSHGQYILKQPTLYSCLKRLETQGFINSYWGEQSNGGRRKYYTLTEMGREVFVQNQDEYEYSRTIIDQLISERAYDLDSVERVSSDEAEEENSFNAVDLIDADLKQAPVYDKAIEAEEHYSDSTQTLTENNPSDTNKPKTIEENSAQNIHDEIASHIESTSVDTATKDEKSFINPASVIDDLLNDAEKNSYSVNLKNEKAPQSKGDDGKDFYFNQKEENSYSFSPSAQYGFAFEEDDLPNSEQASTMTDIYASAAESAKRNDTEFISYDSIPQRPNEQQETRNNNYKSILSNLVDDFNAPPDVQPAQDKLTKESIIAESNLSVKEKIQVRNFGKLSQSIRELGEEVKIRTPDSNAVKEFNKQYYYYKNKFLLFQYGALFPVMLLECLLTFVIIITSSHTVINYGIPLFVCSILFCLAFPITAGILYLFEPYKRKRIDFNFKSSIIFRLIIMLQLILITYAINVYAGMPVGGSEEYLYSTLLPCLLSTNVPLSGVFAHILHRSNKFAVK